MKIKIEVDTGDNMSVQSFMQYTDKLLAVVNKLCDTKQESDQKDKQQNENELLKD